jgi:hypothetical protein
MNMSNKEASVEELVFDREYTVEDYVQARRHALYLPDSDAMLLYVAWCSNGELRMATMFGLFWTLYTTPMTNIEDIPLMIMAGMCTNRNPAPMVDHSFQVKASGCLISLWQWHYHCFMETMSFDTSNKSPPTATVKYIIHWIFCYKMNPVRGMG